MICTLEESILDGRLLKEQDQVDFTKELEMFYGSKASPADFCFVCHEEPKPDFSQQEAESSENEYVEEVGIF